MKELIICGLIAGITFAATAAAAYEIATSITEVLSAALDVSK